MLARVHLGFRARLIATMIALVTLVGLVIGAMLMVYLFEDAKNRALEKLDLGEQMTNEIIKGRTSLLYSRLTIAVKDFGFRSAIARGDPATLDSALENHSRRAGADFAILMDSARNPLASTLNKEFPELVESLYSTAKTEGFGQTFALINGQGYEVLLIPVNGPGLRAWLLSGFALNQKLAGTIAQLSGTNLIFRARQSPQHDFQIFSATIQMDPDLNHAFTRPRGNNNFLDNDRYFTRIVTLNHQASPTIQALLLIDKKATQSNYYRRAGEIALMVGIILIFAIALALIMARHLGRPVLELASYAREIGEGNTPKPPNTRVSGELGQLKDALGDMLIRLREREAEVHHTATHDEVTGLGNRRALMQRARALFADNDRCTLIGIRLNDLSNLNDTLGLEFGDQLLIGFSERLRTLFADAMIIAKTGGEEFLVMVPPCSPKTLATFTSYIRESIGLPLNVNNTPFSLRTTLIAMRLPEDASSTDELRRRVNLTFDQAREDPDSVTHYRPGRDESHLRELRLISDLHTAIINNGLHMNYQPKLNTMTGELVQVEALVRWIHPELGFISPEDFIFLAEQSGQIHELTTHILQRVAADARGWASKGLNIGVAINLSPMDLVCPDLTDHIAYTFAGWHQDMDRITLEVTESALMKDPQQAMATLKKLRDLGVTLSVDDFGTGYSSLSHLRNLPVQELKIDKSFVLKLDTEPQDQLIVKSTIEMAHGLGLKVVAEGIENLKAWHLLRNWGCDLGQGFYLSRPVAAEDLFDTEKRLATMHSELTNRKPEINS